ncbi:hypothetical protein ACNF40_01015 [Cuniculiplasma sp. SKW4]|uniref:hypothetical protein n=1 Tax=Cuniculiplasma sp. SKW4 TaxID=3400171 RepID=UPI003FD52FBD
MEGKMLITCITISLLLVVSMNAFGYGPASPKVYTYDNMSILPMGEWTEIGFGSTVQSMEWQILNVSSGKFLVIHHESTERIQTSYQNSVIELFQGKGLKGAEVYSFTNSGVDASLAIKNTGNSKINIAPIFIMKTGPHYKIYTGAMEPKTILFNQRNSVYTLNGSDFELTQGSVNVNWVADMSLFHSGIVSHKISSNVISLPFGPIQLLRNETYTVDPTIRPNMIIGGGGGGGSSEPPTIGSFSVANSYPSVFENGTHTFQFNYYIISMGSYASARIGFFVADPSYYYYQIGSTLVYHTGSYTFSVTPNYIGQWEQFGIAVYYDGWWDFQGAAGHSFIVYQNTACGYTYPNSGYVGGGMKPILDSGGKIVGEIFGDIQSPNVLTPGYYLQYQLMSGVATRNNDYEVNSVGMYLNYTNNSMGQTPLKIKKNGQYGVQQYLFFSSYQNYQNSSSWPLIDEILWTAAFSVASTITDGAPSALFAAGGALNPFLFSGRNTENTPPQMNFTYTQNAGVGVMDVSPYWGGADYYYNALGTKYGLCDFKPSYLFDAGDEIDMQISDSSATTSYVVDYFQFTMVYSIFNGSKDLCYDSFPNLYTGSYSVSVYLPEEVVVNT